MGHTCGELDKIKKKYPPETYYRLFFLCLIRYLIQGMDGKYTAYVDADDTIVYPPGWEGGGLDDVKHTLPYVACIARSPCRCCCRRCCGCGCGCATDAWVAF